MAGLRKKTRIRLIVGGLVLLAVSAALIGYAMRDGIQYFKTPSEVLADRPDADQTFRIGGLVEAGTLVREGTTASFSITDGTDSMLVRYEGILPDLFREGQGTIATGKLNNDVFEASVVLAKHDEDYMPKELVDALKEQGVYVGSEGFE